MSGIVRFLKKLIRLPLRFIPEGARVPMLLRTLRGKRWIARSGVNAFWMGTHDVGQRKAIEASVSQGDVFYDIGANVGFYSLLGSALVGETGSVIAFEPSPRNLSFLHEHLKLNHVENVRVMEVAVGESPGNIRFHEETNNALSHADASGEIEVPMVSLDDLVKSGSVPAPDYVKIDVVGSEMGVLRGAKELLATKKPVLFMQIHTYDRNPGWLRYLDESGYAVQPVDTNDMETAQFLRAASRS